MNIGPSYIEGAIWAALFRDLDDVTDQNWRGQQETRRPHMDEITVVSFPQTWGSTALGYGGVGGSAMTTAQTTVVLRGGEACVYFGGTILAYKVHVTSEFTADMKAWNVSSAAHAEMKYDVK